MKPVRLKIFVSSVQKELAQDRRAPVALWRDWLTTEVLAGYHLTERQLRAVAHVRKTGKIANSEY